MTDSRPGNESLQTWNDGDDRGIDDAQVLGAVHPQLAVHDSTLPNIRAHLAGADEGIGAVHRVLQVLVQLAISLQASKALT